MCSPTSGLRRRSGWLVVLVLVGCGHVSSSSSDGGTAAGGSQLTGTGGTHAGGGYADVGGHAGNSAGSAGASGSAGQVAVGSGGATVAGGSSGGTGDHSGHTDAGADTQPVQLGPPLIDSTPDGGLSRWTFTPQAAGYGTGTFSTADGRLCATLTNDTSGAVATIGWPTSGAPGVLLPAGDTFQLSFLASATTSLLTFLDKVGGTVSPYATDFETTDDAPATTTQEFTHVFVSAGESSAGIAFVFSAATTAATTVCISNVSLRRVVSSSGG